MARLHANVRDGHAFPQHAANDRAQGPQVSRRNAVGLDGVEIAVDVDAHSLGIGANHSAVEQVLHQAIVRARQVLDPAGHDHALDVQRMILRCRIGRAGAWPVGDADTIVTRVDGHYAAGYDP